MIAGSIVLAGLIIAGSIFFTSSKPSPAALAPPVPDTPPGEQPAPQPPAKVDVAALGPSLGKDDAPITIIEFSDYECPFCSRAVQSILPLLKKEYIETGKVRFVYRDFPLTNIHPNAEISALAARCAGDQNKYWDMHDKIFSDQEKISADDLKAKAKDLKLNTDEFNKCLDSKKHEAAMRKDFIDGVAAGVTGTPTFFVNGKPIVGAVPFTQLKAAIDAALAEEK